MLMGLGGGIRDDKLFFASFLFLQQISPQECAAPCPRTSPGSVECKPAVHLSDAVKEVNVKMMAEKLP
jgi:hypothetical protein